MTAENSDTHKHFSDSDVLVEFRDVHFAYGDRPVLKGINLTIPRGKVTAILGPSGTGKTTLLNFIGGRLHPDRGDIIVDGLSVPKLRIKQLYELRKRMGMLFQSGALLTDINVFENIAFPIREHSRLPEPVLRSLVLLKLEMVGLRGARQLMPSELSGGMARRVALARAIALDPMLVMYDEPFTGLDPISMAVIVKLIGEVNDALGITSVVVTHDVAEAYAIAHYMYLVADGQIIAQGTPEELQASQQAQVRQFMDGLPDGPVPYHYPAVPYADDLLRGDLD